jgi:hypothetical protein
VISESISLNFRNGKQAKKITCGIAETQPLHGQFTH